MIKLRDIAQALRDSLASYVEADGSIDHARWGKRLVQDFDDWMMKREKDEARAEKRKEKANGQG